jgi:glycosyltransferase involved in cell wall biosynthesis
MRVLMLTQFYPPIVGGEERHVRNLAAHLSARGHFVNVATLWVPNTADHEMDGDVGVYRIRGTLQRMSGLFSEGDRRHAPPFPDPELVLALKRVISEVKPEVVHAHNWLVDSFLPLKKWSGAKLVVTIHDYSMTCANKNLIFGDEVCDGARLLKCVRCARTHYGSALLGAVTTVTNYGSGFFTRRIADKFIVVSNAVAKYNRLNESGVCSYEVIPTFVPDDISTLSEEIDPRLHELPPDGYVLFVGDMTHGKGADILLKAYAGLDRSPPLVMIGRQYPEYLPADLLRNVYLLGPWPHDAIMHAWSRCLFGVVPSVAPEACGTVVMEAMALSKPVIITNNGAMPDLADSEAAMIILPNNVDALARAMQALLDNPELIPKMGGAGLAQVERLKASPVVSRIEQVYQTVLGEAA